METTSICFVCRMNVREFCNVQSKGWQNLQRLGADWARKMQSLDHFVNP
jgi:hypothetical protein